MDFIIIRINKVYYIKSMLTGDLYNPQVIEDLRRIRDLINEGRNSGDVEAYRLREQAIRDILNY